MLENAPVSIFTPQPLALGRWKQGRQSFRNDRNIARPRFLFGDRSLAQLALQRAPVHVQRPRGGGDIAAVLGQHALDVLPFQPRR